MTDPMTDLPPVPKFVHPNIYAALERNRTSLREQGGSELRPLADAAALAEYKAREFIARGSAYADYQPGNMTSYGLALIDLVDQQAQAYLSRALIAKGAFDSPPTPFLEEDRIRMHVEARDRTEREHVGPAYRWGGPLLIALPQNAGGRSCCLALVDYYDSFSITEYLGLRLPDAVPVAEFLTLFGSAVSYLREREVRTPRWPIGVREADGRSDGLHWGDVDL
jgi:hypothetical protein